MEEEATAVEVVRIEAEAEAVRIEAEAEAVRVEAQGNIEVLVCVGTLLILNDAFNVTNFYVHLSYFCSITE